MLYYIKKNLNEKNYEKIQLIFTVCFCRRNNVLPIKNENSKDKIH